MSRLPTQQPYLFKIAQVRPMYGVAVSEGKARCRVEEFAHPVIVAECQWPRKLAGRETHLSILASRESYPRECPGGYAVGYLTMRGAVSEYLGALPIDGLFHTIQAAMMGGLQFVYLAGDQLHRGVAAIRTMTFYDSFDVAELEEEERQEQERLKARAGKVRAGKKAPPRPVSG